MKLLMQSLEPGATRRTYDEPAACPACGAMAYSWVNRYGETTCAGCDVTKYGLREEAA